MLLRGPVDARFRGHDGEVVSKGTTMSIEALKSALPDYAKDLKLNLSNVLTTPGMTASQI